MSKSTESADQDTSLKVDNAEVDQKLIDSIIERRNNVLDQDGEVETARVQGGVSNSQADKLYKTYVNQYVQDALKLLKGNGFPNYIWPNDENYTLGSLTIQPPTPIEIAWRQARPPDRIGPDPPQNPTSMPPKYSIVKDTKPEPRRHTVNGLVGFTRAPSEFQEKFTVAIKGPDGVGEHTLSVSQAMPRTISREAFQLTDSLLNQLGVDVDVSEKQKEASGEYSIATVGDISDKFHS